MDMSKSLDRMRTYMGLQGRYRTAMMACTAGRVDDTLLEELTELTTAYESLLEDSGSDDMLVKAEDLRQGMADIADWRARALETARRYEEAIVEFERAADMFDKIGKKAEAQRSRDKAGGLRLDTIADFDAELKRLHGRLEMVQAGRPDHVEILIALGELHSKANDDFEAIQFLEKAEVGLEELGGHPTDGNILSALTDTVQRIQNGEQVAGSSPVEASIQRRAMTQRLLLALANAYRTTDPAKAAEYETRLRSLDSGKDSNMQELMGKFLDAGQDVGKFLKDLPNKR